MKPTRKTKIICTIGPATSSPEIIRTLIKSGMNCARFNMSHGDHLSHEKNFNTIKQIAEEENTHISILIDLQGPKIRIGEMDSPAEIVKNSKILLTMPDFQDQYQNNNYLKIPLHHKFPINDIELGHRILINDGIVGLLVIEKKDSHLLCSCFSPGILSSKKGVNLPDSNISTGSLTEKDKIDIEFAVKVQADFIAISFVNNENDILNLKKILDSHNFLVPVIAKIERPHAVESIDRILDNCEGIMIARGDLGVEINRARVPFIQKRLLLKAKFKRKISIVATQMIESMITTPVPTRAEVSDIANSVLDLTDATMLSAETASGMYPIESVKIMDEILVNAEQDALYLEDETTHLSTNTNKIADITCHAAFQAAFDLGFPTIIAYTMSGSTAELISKHRPASRIIAITGNKRTADKLSLCFGVTPILILGMEKMNEPLEPLTIKILKKVSDIDLTGPAVVITGLPLGISGCTNTIRIINLDNDPS